MAGPISVGEAVIKLGFDGDSLKASLNSQSSKIEKQARNLGSNSGKQFSNAVSTAAGNILSGAVSKGVGLLNGHLDGAIRRVDTLNNAPKTFKAMGYSVEDVNSTMDDLNSYLDGLPTTMDTAIGEVQTLSASFGGLKNGTKYFKAMNDAGLAFGSTSADIERAIVQLSQIDLNGPLDAATWNSLRNAGFEPVFSAMAQEAGVTVGELKESFGKDGTKTVQDFLDELTKMDTEGTGSMQSLSEMARLNTDGIGTAVENLNSRINKAIGMVIQDVGPEKIAGWINDFSSKLPALADNVSDLANKVADAIQFLKDHQDVVEGVGKAVLGVATGITLTKKTINGAISTYQTFSDGIDFAKKAAGHLSDALGGTAKAVLNVGKAIKNLKAVGNIAKLLTVNPAITLAVVAIGAAIAAVIAFWPQIQDFFSQIGAAFQQFWDPIQKGFDWFFNNVIAPVKDFLYNVLIAGIALVAMAAQGIWDNLVKFGNWLNDTFFTPIKNAVEELGNKISDTFNAVKTWLDDHIFGPIKNAFDILGANISNAFETAKENIKKAIEPIVNWFNEHIKAPIENAFDKIKEFATSAFQAIKDKVSEIFSTIGGIIKTPINGIIDGINGVLGNLNNLKVPDWVPGLGGKSPHFGMIQRLAGGGFADQATPAIFGENGAEVVLPLERNTDNWSGLLAGALTRAMDEEDTTSGRPIYVNMTNEINNEMDAEDIGRVLMTSIRRAA